MKKIGFIDYFLDNWHANNYPAWIRENIDKKNRQMELAYAWAEKDKEDGLTTAEWCEKYGVKQLASLEEIVEKSDYLIVLAPDHPETHERLSKLALMSQKPVYIDKTFSPDVKTGIRMFDLAEKHQTPMFSSSALRYAEEFADYPNEKVNRENIECIITTGPGKFDNYSIHQFEMIAFFMGVGAERVKSLSTEHGNLLVIEYKEGRQAVFSQFQHAPFQVNIQLKDGEGVWIPDCTDIFPRLIDSILTFFETRVPPVPKDETLEIMALIDAGKKALKERDVWVPVEIE